MSGVGDVVRFSTQGGPGSVYADLDGIDAAAPVLAGARAAAAGADLDAVVDVVNRTIDRTQVRFVVESLDRLRRTIGFRRRAIVPRSLS